MVTLPICLMMLTALELDPAHMSVRPLAAPNHLSASGVLVEFVRLAETGTYRIAVRAHAEAPDAPSPVMVLSLDRLPWKRVAVDSAESREYVFDAALTATVHAIGVEVAGSAPLVVEGVSIQPPANVIEPEIADVQAWNADAAAREAAVVAQAEESIRELRTTDAVVEVTDAKGNPVADATVWIQQEAHAFLFGCNICGWNQFPQPGLNDTYKRRFAELFNYATVPFYWALYEKERGKPTYAITDAIAEWCVELGIEMKGHTLLWANEAGIPPWSRGLPPEDVQRARVFDLMGRYTGKIGYWEVVNEPVNAPGVPVAAPQSWAREVDPNARLIINEYGVFYEGHPRFFAFLENAARDSVSFDAIGIQAHAPVNMAFPLDRVRTILDAYAALGKKIHITEFTPPSNGRKVLGAPWRDAWTEEEQADYAEQFYRVCFAHPAVAAISWWDFSDTGAWVPGGGLLRADCSLKPAYERLRDLIRKEWWTGLEEQSDAKGRAPFRGAYGRYLVKARYAGVTAETTFALGRDTEKRVTLTLTPAP